MTQLTRRSLLLAGCAATLISVAPGARAQSSATGAKLIVIILRGAMDGLNAVVPYAEAEYRKLRPTIGIPAPAGGSKEAALDLDGFFGLHPALEPLLPLWKDGSLAAVHAVGSPDTASVQRSLQAMSTARGRDSDPRKAASSSLFAVSASVRSAGRYHRDRTMMSEVASRT